MMSISEAGGPGARVFVVDDDAGVRDSVAALLSAKGLAHECLASGPDLLARLEAGDAGCVLLDYSMEELDGLETLKALRTCGLTLPVIMITGHGDIELAVRSMRAGASDFVEKPWDRNALFDALERALEQDRRTRERTRARAEARDILASFTPRERDVFARLIKGATNKEVARELGLSPRTVEFYRANLLEKSGVSGIAGLVRLAFQAQELEV